MQDESQVPAVWREFASVCGLEGDAARAKQVLKTSIMPKGSDAEVAAFLAVCVQYKLNPLTKQIYAFPSKGGVQPMVGIDGWLAIAARQPDHEAIDVDHAFDDAGKLVSATAKIWRRGIERPTTATEYLVECQRNTEPWRQSPCRMLGHRATIQAIRRAYSVAGIMDAEDAERMRDAEARQTRTVDARSAIIEHAAAAARVDVLPPEPEAAPEPGDGANPEPQPTPEDIKDWSNPEPTTSPEDLF